MDVIEGPSGAEAPASGPQARPLGAVAAVIAVAATAPITIVALYVVGVWSDQAAGRLAAVSWLIAAVLVILRRSALAVSSLAGAFAALSLWTLLQPGGRHPTLLGMVVVATVALLYLARLRFGRPCDLRTGRRFWAAIVVTVIAMEVVGTTNLGMTIKTWPFATSMNAAVQLKPSTEYGIGFNCPAGRPAPGPFPGFTMCPRSDDASPTDVVIYEDYDAAPFVMHPNGPSIASGLVYSPGGAPDASTFGHRQGPVCVNHVIGHWYEYFADYPSVDSNPTGSRCPAGLTELTG